MYKLKSRILSGFMAMFITLFTSVCPVLNAQAEVITVATGIAVGAKVVLTAALAAGGLIAMGEVQGSVTPAQKAEVRTKVGQLEDQFIAQEIKRADSQVQTATYIKDGVMHYVPIVKAGVKKASSAVASKISYVSKDFLSSWYDFLHQQGVWATGLPDISGVSYSGSYDPSIYSVSGSSYTYNTVVRYSVSSNLDSPIMKSLSLSGTYPHRLVAISGRALYGSSAHPNSMYLCYFESQLDYSTHTFISAFMPFELGGVPLFTDRDSARAYSLGLSNDGVLNIESLKSSYSFGLTQNIPVKASGVMWPKTWVGGEVADLPVSGVTITDVPDLPDLSIPNLGQDVLGTAVPIDLGADIPGLWTEGGEVSSDVISGTGVGTGELPWELPVTGDLPFPIPGVAFPGAIPAENDWPAIQDKVQTGEIDTDIDIPGVGDVTVDGFPIVDNIPEEKDVEDFADKVFPWALDKLTLPDGLFDKIPFSIPRDIYWLMQAVTAQDIGGGTGQPDPSTTGVSGDVIAVDFTKSDITWRTAPHIKGTWNFPFEKLGKKDVKVPVDIDCSQYDYFAALVWFAVAIIWTAVILRSILSSFASM